MYNTRVTELDVLQKTINKFKCVTESQIQMVMPDTPKARSNPDLYKKLINRMIYDKTATRNGEIITLFGQSDYNEMAIDSLWTLLAFAEVYMPSVKPAELSDIVIATNHPCTFAFIGPNSKIYKVICAYSESMAANILLEQEHFYHECPSFRGNEAAAHNRYIIITRDIEMLAYIGDELAVTLPHQIALLEGDILQKPQVKFFSNIEE